MPTPATKTYLVERHNEVLKVTVPEDWKVTFGPLFTPSKGGYGGPANCIRFYETKEKQRAIFMNVTGFRDLSIPVMKQVKIVKKQDNMKKDANSMKSSSEVEVESEWVEQTEVVL